MGWDTQLILTQQNGKIRLKGKEFLKTLDLASITQQTVELALGCCLPLPGRSQAQDSKFEEDIYNEVDSNHISPCQNNLNENIFLAISCFHLLCGKTSSLKGVWMALENHFSPFASIHQWKEVDISSCWARYCW